MYRFFFYTLLYGMAKEYKYPTLTFDNYTQMVIYWI